MVQDTVMLSVSSLHGSTVKYVYLLLAVLDFY